MDTRPPTREEQAHLEVGHTDVSAAVARALVAAFLALACLLPLFELVRVAQGDAEARAPWSRLAQIGADMRTAAAAAAGGAWNRTVTINRAVLEGLHAFEDGIEEESRIGRMLRPRAQRLLSGALGVGNEQAYIGRDGWLFFRRDVDYVTSRGFLHDEQLARRVVGADEWTTPPQPDPRKAIRSFHEQLAAQGITLIVVPVPVKPTVHPERLSGRSGGAQPPANPDHARLVEALRTSGIRVFDPTVLLFQAGQGGATQYMATDTHWRPEAMEGVAAALADDIRGLGMLASGEDPGYEARPVDVSARGDVFAMLDLPATQRLFGDEHATIRRITIADGSPWRSSPGADVLVLGDSFSNIYSLESMGWGTAAGFVEQLSFSLRRPLDRIVQNDAGAYATREILHRAGPERLRGKKIVVWQFATRELAFGDWRVY